MSIASFAPSQQAQHFDENANGSTQFAYLYNSAIYLFSQDVVGSGGSGGSTSQFFVYKSTDNGANWSDITPGSPTKIGSSQGQMVVRSGDKVYLTNITNTGGRSLGFFVFDLATEAWDANAAIVTISATTIANSGLQCCSRSSDGAILVAYSRLSTLEVLTAVYLPLSDTWTVAPTAVTGVDVAQVTSAGVDSRGVAHFFACQWSGVSYGSGSATLRHWTVATDDTISASDLAYTFANIPDKSFPWNDAGEPVFYLDGSQKITLPIGTRDNASPFTGNIVGAILLTAVEADVPIWSTVSIPTGENFADVTLANSQVTAMFVLSLLPIEFDSETQLHIFWTSNGQAIAGVGDDWNNYLRRISYTDSVFSAVTTEYSTVGETMPGSLYPLLISNDGTTALVGGFFPTIDYLLFTSGATKYDSLALWWLSFTVVSVGPIVASCNNPPNGSVGTPYDHFLLASGGTPPLTFTLASGSLPSGLSLNSATGEISGTPTAAGTFSFAVVVTGS